MQYATLSQRIIGGLVDFVLIFIILFCISAICNTIATVAGSNDSSGGLASILVLLSGLVQCLLSLGAIAYFIVMEGQSGQTIGKRVAKIRVIKEDGTPMDYGTATIRTLLRIVDGLFFYIVGIIIISQSQKKQRLGDIVAKTIVVQV